MPKFNYSIGDGNEGVSRMFPSGSIEALTVDRALDVATSDYVKEFGVPDSVDYVDSGEVSAVWYEIEGAPALNGGAALIIEVWREDD